MVRGHVGSSPFWGLRSCIVRKDEGGGGGGLGGEGGRGGVRSDS